MRTLLLFRGAPGCGKSTFIVEHGLKDYTLCADDIRMLCQSPQQTVDGSVQIGCDNERVVWDMLFKLLEIRMQKGEFTVIDATNSKAIEMNRYKKLADDYRYRLFIIDMTDLPIEECKRRNAGRIPLKRVPEEVIDKMYARFRTQKIPSGIKVLKPDELDQIWIKKIDLSHYKKIVHIGDIHGCYTALKEYFDKNELRDDYFYCFTGDYLDRGLENVEVLRFLLSIKDKKNVFMLVGNHECMHKDTEVLTSEGWKYLRDVDIEKDEVAQYDIESNEISYAKPLDKTSHFEEKLIDIETFDSHQIVTKNHDIIYKNRKLKAINITKETVIEQNDIPFFGYCKQEDYDIDDNDLKLLVWIITDGTIVRFKNSIKKRIQFHFTRQDKIDNLRQLLRDMGISYSFYPCKHKKPLSENRKQDYVIIIYGEMARYYDKMINFRKIFPFFFTKLSQRQFYIVLDEIIKTDGHKLTSLRIAFSTTEKENADIIQQMCIKNNSSCTINLRDNSCGYNKNGTIYELTIKPYGVFPSKNVKVNEIDYNDIVYCLQMPKGTMVTRYNGKVAITGNCHIDRYAHDKKSNSREFELVTKKQLDEAKFDKKELRQFYRKLGQCAWYHYGDIDVFVCHGGISTLPDNPTLIATNQMIKGVGNYGDFEAIADSWMKSTGDNVYQIYGHRNTKNLPIKVRDRVFNLEGRVEFGGQLRIVELDENGFHEVEVQNTVFREPEEFEDKNDIIHSDVATAVLTMRNSKWIQEKAFGNISSFNFTRKAFEKAVWDNLTIHTRGLFIDTESMIVCARSLDKFFHIGEGDCPDLDNLQNKLQFPVAAYVKENGFLGLVSYNHYENDLLITTKSSLGGDFQIWFKDMLYKKITSENIEKLKNYVKDNNVTFLFECVDVEHDPHIIEYPESELFLLDVVANNLEFSHASYTTLTNVAEKFGLKVKTLAYELSNWQEFYDWYQMVNDSEYQYDGKYIEGFVVEDSENFMFKVKGEYYNFWKKMRGVAAEVFRKGYIDNTGKLYNAESNYFYDFLRKLYEETEPEKREELSRDIVTLRRMFYNASKGD